MLPAHFCFTMNAFLPRIIATAGHIDHGKSTLVEALTGTNPDRLPEEIKRGLTIEPGFAHLSLPDPQHPGGGWHAGVVDVPGHADYVRNMVCGLSHVDAALLTVAADDGWMPQTEEHFEILLYLHIHRGVVVLTKSDLLTDRAAAEAELRARLAGTPWAAAPIVPVCAISGEGLDELRTALAEVLRVSPPPADTGKPRLHVDRAFSPRGAGTVVTGTLTGGTLTAGAEVTVQPGGQAGRIRGLQNHGRNVETAHPGMRTAARLGGVEVGKEGDGAGTGVRRGHTITTLSGGLRHGVLHAALTRLARRADAPALRHGSRVWLHCGTASHEARVYLAGQRELLPGAAAIAEFRARTPVCVFAGDRFLVRDWSRRHTLAGGLVLEPHARARAWRHPAWRHALQQRADHPEDAGIWVAGLLERDGWLNRAGLLEASHFSADTIAAAVEALPLTKACGTWLLSSGRWRQLLETAGAAVAKYHEQHPADPGLKLQTLRNILEPQLPDAVLAEHVISGLCGAGFVREQDHLRAATFRPETSPAQRAAMDAIRQALAADPLSPPGLGTIAATPAEREALQLLVAAGEVTRLNAETALLTTAVRELRQRIILHLRRFGRDTVAGLRDAVGSSRRILVPFCELLDRENVTRRSGDWRTLHARYASDPESPGPGGTGPA